MLLGGRAGNLLVLTTVLISFISGDKKDCTPETQLSVQYIKCEYSTETADCPASSIGSVGTPLETVNDISVYKYLNTSNNYTGVKISWSSPSATSLNATGGYLVRLYYNLTNGNRVLLLCRHFKIRYTREIVRLWEADYKFVLLEPSLPLYKTVIQIELESLPSNSIGYAPSLATSQFITLGNPLDHESNLADQSTISIPGNLTAKPFIERGNDYNDVVISRSSPNASVNLIWWITLAAVAILIIVLLTLFIIYKRKRITTTDVSKCFKGSTHTPHSQTTRSLLNDFNGIHSGKVTVCIAYPSGSHYQEFNKILRSVLENHFNCEVMIYNGNPSNPDAYKHCDYVIVVYSPQLLGTHYFFLQQPSVVPMEQKQHKTVLDLVLKPQRLSSPAVLFVTFDNVSSRNVNSLISWNSSLRIFKLPTESRLLFAELYNSNNTMTLNESMEYYEEGPLKECLDTAVDMITSSGVGDLENDTQTVYTGLQHDDRYGSCYNGNIQSTTPRADEQQFLPTRQDFVDHTLASAPPAEFPPIPDVSVTGYTEVEEPSFVPQPNHTIMDETRKPNGTHVHVSVDSSSALSFKSGSNECESIPASEDSFNCSDLTSSVFPGRSVGPESSRQTFEC